MNVPRPLYCSQAPSYSSLLQCASKSDCSVVWHDLVSCRVDQEGWCCVGAKSQLGDGRDAGYESAWGWSRPGFIVGGSKAIQEHGEAIPLFEEREDKLGAWVAGAQPAQVATIGGIGGYGIICDLLIVN